VESFSDRLKGMMKNLGMQQNELAKKTGLSKGIISMLINEPDRDLRVSSLLALAKALRVDPLWLYTGISSSEYAAVQENSRGVVPVIQLSEVTKHPSDALPLLPSNVSVRCDYDHEVLIAVIAEDDRLKDESGIGKGDIAIVDLTRPIASIEDGSIYLVLLPSDVAALVRAFTDFSGGGNFGTDDPRHTTVPISKSTVLGRVIEIRRQL
jgi:transcriptional regulator with XRE-family HTH domain